MTAKWCARFVAASMIVAAVLLPAAGCGKKRKAGPTIVAMKADARNQAPPDRKAAALLKIARMEFALKSIAEARKTVREAFEAMSSGDRDPNQFAPRLVETAAAAMLVSDKTTARVALDLAIENAGNVEDASRRAKVYADAGALYGDKRNGLGDTKKANQWLAKATEVAESVEPRFRAEALAAVALGYSNSGMGTEAAKLVEKLQECAADLEEPRAKAEALAAAASVQARNGKKDEATDLLTDASGEAKRVERVESRAYALLAVAEAMILNGDKKGARSLLKEAEKSADKVSDAELRQMALDKVRAAIKEAEKK